MKLTNEIQLKLLSHARGHAYDIIIPNYYFARYEMDLFKLSESGMITEYEIKISRGDFRNDFKKFFEVYNPNGKTWRDTIKIMKHEELAAGRGKINRFWFVTPAGLISKTEVPRHAGLLEYNLKRGSFDVVKNAPLITKEKTEIDFKALCRSLSFREQNLKAKMNARK